MANEYKDVSKWGQDMDAPAHLQMYKWFLYLSKWGLLGTALILLLLFLFIFI
ncbi:MAG: aa3-type cytochrome c oxidase subunit IV [Alphaproteobacteria bacterium]|nr:aa3-type cytochrome c oxidase subunit IV [Alphaproteobacteria bacterium]